MSKNIEVKLFEPSKPQRDALRVIYQDKPLITAMAFGRQVGKSFLMVMDAIAYSLNHPAVNIAYISPTWGQNVNMMDKVDQLFVNREEEKKIVFKNIKYKEQKYFFHNGSNIEFMSAEQGDLIRGRTKHRVYIDEAAFMKRSFVFKVVMPFVTRTGGRVVMGSTFNGRNWYFKLVQQGQRKENKKRVISLLRTYKDLHDKEVNKVINELKSTMTKAEFMQEVMCIPVNKDTLFTNIEGAVRKPSDFSKKKLYISWDLGVSSDFTVVTVMTEDFEVVEVDRFNMRENDLTPMGFKDRLMKLYYKYFNKINVGYMEINNNELLYEEVIDSYKDTYKILPLITESKNKSKMISNLVKLFEDNEIAIPDNDNMIEELNGFRGVKLDSGRMRYKNIDAAHDDYVMSLAIVAWCVREENDGGIIETY